MRGAKVDHSLFLIDISDIRADPIAVKHAADEATGRFAILARSYAAVIGKSNKVFESLEAKPGDTAAAKPDVTAISITNPGPQTGKVGAPISPVVSVVASGPGQLSFSATGLPKALSIDSPTGTISGTPAAAGVSHVIVTVTSDAFSAVSAIAQFDWIVTV